MSEKISDEQLKWIAKNSTVWTGDVLAAAVARELLAYRAAWAKYGDHDPACETVWGYDEPKCTCGFDDLPEFLKGETK